MHKKSRFFELQYTKFKTKHLFFIELTEVSEMANFRLLANFRFTVTLTLYPVCFLLSLTSAQSELYLHKTGSRNPDYLVQEPV